MNILLSKGRMTKGLQINTILNDKYENMDFMFRKIRSVSVILNDID